MIQIKKTILTLVALLAVTTGAWAEETKVYTEAVAISQLQEGDILADGFSITAVADYELIFAENRHKQNGTISIYGQSVSIEKIKSYGANGKVTITMLSGDVDFTPVTDDGSDGNAWVVTEIKSNLFGKDVSLGGIKYASASSGPEVAWDNDKKTGQFTMPGGNVELEPEYYPQAELTTPPTAIDNVPATTDGAIVNAGTVKNIGETETAQGTVMYYAVQSATAPTAPDYDATGWTDKVPTATDFAEGNVYVWYYVKGADGDETSTFNDGAITKLGESGYITLLAAPTYAITFADDTAEPDKWTASPNANVTKGDKVTVTYTGAKKVLGVKAEKKAPVTYPMVSEATAADYGKVVCAAGHLHDAKTAVPSGCTAVGILGKVTETGHGLILALQNATSQTWNTINGWESVTTYAGTTLKLLPDNDARGSLTSYTALGSTTVSDWAVAQKSDYEAIFINLGSTNSDEDGTTYDGNVNAYITTGVGGTAISGTSWSATAYNGTSAWNFAQDYWNNLTKTNSYSVRPVLAF